MLCDMLQAFAQYRILTAVFIVACILMVVMLVFAVRAVRRHNRERDAVLKRLKEEERLRRKYETLTDELVRNADGAELLHALALRIQRNLENEADMNAAFLTLPVPQQYIYALDYVFCEDTSTLSAFFRTYGSPLTDAALHASEEILPDFAEQVFRPAFVMFDENDETTSCTKGSVQKADEAFAQTDMAALTDSVKSYIANNLQAF